jgi:two-component system cell cycle response regulator
MIGPLLAAGVVVGVLVPRATDRAADAVLKQAVATATKVLGERCLGLGDLAISTASRFDALGPAVRADATAASAVLGQFAATRPDVTLLLVTADRTVAASGPLAGTWDPASAIGASCQRRSTGGSPRSQLVESVDLPVVAGLPPTRVVAVQPLDGDRLARLRDDLGLGGVRLALLPDDGGAPAAVSGTASGGRPPEPALRRVLQEVGRPAASGPAVPGPAASGPLASGPLASGTGESQGWRYRVRTAPPGVPYAVVALTRPEGGGLQRTLAVVVVLATIALLVTLAVLTSRLTRPLAELTAVARRLGGGDLTARTGIHGVDEVGTLAAAFDAMADELESTVEELRSKQSALSHTFARFGEALGATHDLEALLRTVVAAAMRGSEATIGTAYLVDAKGLARRVASPEALTTTTDGESSPALAGLADLADDAVRRGELVVTDLVDAAGPALAVPLRRDERIIGALAVARDVGSAPFDPLALEAVTALAAHAGTAVANVRTHEETSKQSITDPLTGAGNLRHLTTTLAKEVERANRFNRPLSLLMLDLDHFKQVNDTAGHAFGDAVLREFARRLAACLRDVDVVARYGGEEFVVVLPETASEGACAVAARIVEAVRSEPFRAGGKSRSVTVSVGVAAFPDHGRIASELTRAADAALYAAKHGGRDRWVLARGAGAAGVPVAQTG